MDQRNFTFLFYGFAAAWAIIAIYVVTLVRREHNIRKQLDNLQRMLDDREAK
ncbi:MAG: CcmD family protein [Bryobacteraceae bacterium]